jgi:predicted amidohydrolase YtcJ
VRAAHGAGYQIALHAIGDRANSICLDAIEMAGASGRGPEYRPRIEHAQILRPRDIARFAEIGVIVSMQPIHCTADMRFVEQRIGAERAKGAYAWRSLLSNQAVLVFGSDWPVETLNPVAGIHAAVTRQDKDHQPSGGWQPQERLTVAEVLRAYTGAAAYAAFWEDSMGTIEEGKLADFTVLSQDLFAISAEEILNTKVLATIVGGEVVFRAPITRER